MTCESNIIQPDRYYGRFCFGTGEKPSDLARLQVNTPDVKHNIIHLGQYPFGLSLEDEPDSFIETLGKLPLDPFEGAEELLTLASQLHLIRVSESKYISEKPLYVQLFDDESTEPIRNQSNLIKLICNLSLYYSVLLVPASMRSKLYTLGIANLRVGYFASRRDSHEVQATTKELLDQGITNDNPLLRSLNGNKLLQKEFFFKHQVPNPQWAPMDSILNDPGILLYLITVSLDNSVFIKDPKANNGTNIFKITKISEQTVRISIPKVGEEKSDEPIHYEIPICDLTAQKVYELCRLQGYDISDERYSKDFFGEQGIRRLELAGKKIECRVNCFSDICDWYIRISASDKDDFRVNTCAGGTCLFDSQIQDFFQGNEDVLQILRGVIERLYAQLQVTALRELIEPDGVSFDVVFEVDDSGQLSPYIFELQGCDKSPAIIQAMAQIDLGLQQLRCD